MNEHTETVINNGYRRIDDLCQREAWKQICCQWSVAVNSQTRHTLRQVS